MNVTERLGYFLEVLTGFLMAMLALITFCIVILRYGFDISYVALQETGLYLHAIAFMLGLAYTLREDAHVRIDVFYERMNPRKQALVNLLGIPFLLWPTCLFILYQSFGYVSDSWAVRETSADPGGLPLVYLLKSLLVVTPLLILLQSFSNLRTNLEIFKKGSRQ